MTILCVLGCDREYDRAQVCEACRSNLGYQLRELPDLCAQVLAGEEEIRDDRPRELRDAKGRPVLNRKGQPIVIPGLPADPVAAVLPAGPVSAPSGGPRVSGGDIEARLPIRIDPIDLSLRAWSLDPLGAAQRRPEAVADAHHDQTGLVPVAVMLDGWARDWAENRGERLPLPVVSELTTWLGIRLEWACDVHPAVDEFAAELAVIHRRVFGAAYGRPPRPELREGVTCSRCDYINTLYTLPGSADVECGSCGQLYDREQFEALVREQKRRGEAA